MDDSLDISLGDSAVPDGLRIDDNNLTVIALVETTRVVGTYLGFESQALDLFFQSCPQLPGIVLPIP